MTYSNPQLAYFALRLVVGLNYLMHGLVRILGDYAGFVQGLQQDFANTFLPAVLVGIAAHLIPVAELIIGLGLVLGLLLRYVLLGAFALMGFLIFGMTLRQQWSTVGTQMVYVLLLYLLLWRLTDDVLSLGRSRRQKSPR